MFLYSIHVLCSVNVHISQKPLLQLHNICFHLCKQSAVWAALAIYGVLSSLIGLCESVGRVAGIGIIICYLYVIQANIRALLCLCQHCLIVRWPLNRLTGVLESSCIATRQWNAGHVSILSVYIHLHLYMYSYPHFTIYVFLLRNSKLLLQLHIPSVLSHCMSCSFSSTPGHWSVTLISWPLHAAPSTHAHMSLISSLYPFQLVPTSTHTCTHGLCFMHYGHN